MYSFLSKLLTLSFFDHLPHLVSIFYCIKVYKKFFLTTYLPALLNVVCEGPLKIFEKKSEVIKLDEQQVSKVQIDKQNICMSHTHCTYVFDSYYYNSYIRHRKLVNVKIFKKKVSSKISIT